MSDVVVRYAPSPTGKQHVGGARTALYNYLYAKQNNGKFNLRIEDTDSKRYDNSAVTELIDALSWLGIEWDAGPSTEELIQLGVASDKANRYGKNNLEQSYVQSNRTEIYKGYVQQLLDMGLAYRVFADEADDGIDMHDFASAAHDMGLRIWRDANAFMIKKALATGNPYHVRAKLPREGYIYCEDELVGGITFMWQREKDFVIQKTDGGTTYHFASVIDDHLMETTHVVRGGEWISSMPKHLWLYEVFGWKPPVFVHTATILNPSGKGKMSKRLAVAKDGKTPVPTLVSQYRDLGFLPQALNNFMAMTGWNPGTQDEHFSMEDLIKLFNFSGLSVRGAAWDSQKLLNVNTRWMRSLSDNEFLYQYNRYLENKRGY